MNFTNITFLLHTPQHHIKPSCLNIHHHLWKSFLPSRKGGGYLKPAVDQSLMKSMDPNIRDISHYFSLNRSDDSKKANTFSWHLLNDSLWNTIVNEECNVYISRIEVILSCKSGANNCADNKRPTKSQQKIILSGYIRLWGLASFRPSSVQTPD